MIHILKPELKKVAINLLVATDKSKIDTSSLAFKDLSGLVITVNSFEALQMIIDNFDYHICHVFIDADVDLDEFKKFVIKSARPDKHIEFDLFDTQEVVAKLYLNNLINKRHLDVKLFNMPLNPFTLRLVIGADTEFVDSFGKNVIYSLPKVTDFALGLKKSEPVKKTVNKKEKKLVKESIKKAVQKSATDVEVDKKEAPVNPKATDKFKKKSAKRIQDIDSKPAIEGEDKSQKSEKKSVDRFKKKPRTDKFKKKHPKKVQDIDVNIDQQSKDVKKKPAAKSQEINITPDVEKPEKKSTAKSQDIDLDIMTDEDTQTEPKKIQDIDLAIDNMDNLM